MEAEICREYEEHQKKLASMGISLATEGKGFVLFLTKKPNRKYPCRSLDEVRLVVGVMTDFSACTVGADAATVLRGFAACARPRYEAFAAALAPKPKDEAPQ